MVFSRLVTLLLHTNYLLMRTLYIVFALGMAFFASCNNSQQATADGSATTEAAAAPAAPKQPMQSILNDADSKLLMTTLTTYYALKNGMVATNADGIKTAATQLAAIADSLNKTLAQNYGADDSIKAYEGIKPFLDTVLKEAKNITTLTDPKCEQQRLSFGPLSSAMYGLLRKVELKNAGVYHEFCPMAFNDKGAYWLSEESEIKNPYFGKKMMECGEVTDSL
jgi:Cu(I)/Ag(I) efflux system membrane fusion protein